MKIESAIPAFRHFSALAELATDEMKKEIPYEPVRGLRLYEKLIRIEKKMNRIATDQCNGGITTAAGNIIQFTDAEEEKTEGQWNNLKEKAKKLINSKYSKFLHFNSDPRGYSIKLEFSKDGNSKAIPEELKQMHQDFGGFLILAPDFN